MYRVAVIFELGAVNTRSTAMIFKALLNGILSTNMIIYLFCVAYIGLIRVSNASLFFTQNKQFKLLFSK